VDARELARYVRTLVPDTRLTFVVDRGSDRLTLDGKTIPLPIERIIGADVHLAHITVFDERQRVILTTPTGGNAPYPTILYLKGLGTQSCELSTDVDEPLRKLLEGFSAAGFATLRVECSGVGDSEGPPFQSTNLFDEVAAYRAALDFLANHPLVGKVILFGHSVGGMIAPLLLGDGANIQGAVVFGTSALHWVDCIVRATRRQKVLAGMSGDELENYVAAWTEMHIEVCRGGYLPWQVFARLPLLSWLEGTACHGETMFGRHGTFFQQLERLDLVALWKTMRTKVLVMHGEFDWACEPDEGRVLASAIAEVDPTLVQFVELPSVGHDMRRHTSMQWSYDSPRNGQWDERIVQTAVEWIKVITQ
jgi:pimeloyl-ACP methyl ester carboxylesterase